MSYEVFIYSGYKSLVIYMICKYFLPFCALSFSFHNDTIWSTIFLTLMKCNLTIFDAHGFDVISKNLCQIWKHECLSLYFLLTVLQFKLSYLVFNPFLVDFYIPCKVKSNFILFYVIIQLFHSVCWKDNINSLFSLIVLAPLFKIRLP